MSEQPSDPVDEAIEMLGSVVSELNQGEPDLKSVLRRCIHAAHLLGLSDAEKNFSWHLTGFPQDQDLPRSRRIIGRVHWSNSPHIYTPNAHIGTRADFQFGTPPTPLTDITPGVDELRAWVQSGGYATPSTTLQPQVIKIKENYIASNSRLRSITVYPWNFYQANDFNIVLNVIREEAFAWAMTTLVRLRYESRVSTIWNRYRSEVDAKIAEMNLNNTLSAIDVEVGSDNPAQWSSALYSCRNMLKEISDYLWQASDEEAAISGRDNKPITLKVTPDKYINRLMVYLYHKSRNDDERRISRNEAEYLGEMMERLYTLNNRGHGSVPQAIAESAALHTYIFLADLIRLTDMEPLTRLPDGMAK